MGNQSDQQRESEEPSQRELSSGNKLPWLGRSRSRTNSANSLTVQLSKIFTSNSSSNNYNRTRYQGRNHLRKINQTVQKEVLRTLPLRRIELPTDIMIEMPILLRKEKSRRISKFQRKTPKISGISDRYRP